MFFISMMLSGLFMYSYFHKHLLSMLLSLEYVVLSLFCMIYYLMNLYGYEMYFGLLYLIMSVCEGALGLSIMVLMVRMYGNDYFTSLNILLC
uniref:NADH dehydrogenase subunit 4L n=1 Tax=Semidalis macleodi TaxID=2919411 RepID=UPI001FA6DB58|nr:NADH dehydrogenase subunit 4L [Semidalis macleodi]ULR86831.1 NADH dehydrogenase subunit 4L [Semidalis macleodi]